MSDQAFDRIVESLDQPMVVVTTAVGDERAGCLVGFHAQSSIDPGRYCLWLSKANHTYRVGLRASSFAVHLLREEDRALAVAFGTRTGQDVDKFADVGWTAGPGGVPLLDDCPNRLVLERIALLDEGSDHVCLTAEIVGAECDERFAPLRLSAVADLEPGHDSDERAPL